MISHLARWRHLEVFPSLMPRQNHSSENSLLVWVKILKERFRILVGVFTVAPSDGSFLWNDYLCFYPTFITFSALPRTNVLWISEHSLTTRTRIMTRKTTIWWMICFICVMPSLKCQIFHEGCRFACSILHHII